MQSIFDGMRAGVVAALALTLWAFIAVGDTAASSATGMAFVATAFGLVGLTQIVYGTAVGALAAVYKRTLDGLKLLPLRDKIQSPTTDRNIAAALLTVPVCTGLVAAGTMATHLAVTSGFARDSFQAQGLALAAAGFTVIAAAVALPLFSLIRGVLARLPFGDNRPIFTWVALGLYGLGVAVTIAVGYSYAVGLHVFDTTELQMGVAALILVPMLTLAMHQWRWDRPAYNVGIPVAGLLVAVGCFAGASNWANSSPEMRSLTFRDAPMVSFIAGVAVEPDTDDTDIWADTDTADDDDEPVSPVEPAADAVFSGVADGDRAQQNTFEEIPDPPKNVVFVMIDTLRQDHMGYAGYEHDTTPNIDKLAADAVVFNDAYATSPHTPRTVPPVFFGRYASNLDWILPNANFPRLTENNTSMYEVKQDHGWHNISKTSHFYFRERRGVNQGFQVWDNDGHKELEDSHDDIATPRIWNRLEPTLEDLGEQHQSDDADPFSIFVHFFDPHARYNHHDEFPFDRGNTHRENLIADYDSEIAHADHYVGKIIDTLKEQDLYDDTIFVITSDHGEAFDEHGYYFHGQTLYNTVLNVPKLIRVPGWFDHEVDGPVSVIDIAPTLLDLLDLPIPDEYEGEALTDVLLGRAAPAERPIFGELLPYTAFEEHHRAVVYGDYKLIVDFTHGIEELYNVAEDPLEQNDLSGEKPEKHAKLREMLDEFMN